MADYINRIGGCNNLNYYDLPFGHANWSARDLDLFAKHQLRCLDEIAARRHEHSHDTRVYKEQFAHFLEGIKFSLKTAADEKRQAASEAKQREQESQARAAARKHAGDVLARMKQFLVDMKTLPPDEALRQADALLQESGRISSRLPV